MQQPLRIALIVNPFAVSRPGGDHPSCLSRELLGLGHTVRGFGAPPGVIPRAGRGGGFGILSFKPDVILAYESLSPAGWHGARMAKRLGVPLLIVEEAFPSVGRSVKRVLRACGEGLWGAWVRRSASKLIALDGVAAEQARTLGVPEHTLMNLVGGLDTNVYRPGLTTHLMSQHGVRGHVVLHVGPQVEGRGLEELLEGFAGTIGRREDWRLLLAGDGAGRNALRSRGHRLGVGSQIHWIDRPRAEEMPGLLASSTLIVDPDRTGGGPRRAIPGALACGLPVLAAEGSRYGSLIDDRVGHRVPREGAIPWADAMRLAATDPQRRARWSRGGRALAEEQLAWPAVARKLAALIQELLTEPPSLRRTA
jgi:glycosyltransferase involved in cell wall biosynthesis